MHSPNNLQDQTPQNYQMVFWKDDESNKITKLCTCEIDYFFFNQSIFQRPNYL